MKSGKIERLALDKNLRSSSGNKVETSSQELLEKDFGIWLEAIREVLGGKNSYLVRALSRDWPKEYQRNKFGLPSTSAFEATVNTWFQNRRTLPNNRLKDLSLNRLGVLECLQLLIDRELPQAPANLHSGLTFTEIVERLREQRERNSLRKKDSGTIDEDLYSKGIVSIQPITVSKVDEIELLLGSSEFDGDVPPYCPRDIDLNLLEKIDSETCNPVILIGPPKSGKTRTLIESLKRSKHSDAKIYWLEPGDGNARKLLERSKTAKSTNILVLDDLQNPRYFGEGGLDAKLIEDLVLNFKIVGTLHDSTKNQWELANLDHRTDVVEQDISSPNKSVQAVLLREQVILNAELSESELTLAGKVLEIQDGDLAPYRYLGSKFASVAALTKALEHELSRHEPFSQALFETLLDAKIVYPKGATLESLKELARIKIESKTNSPWADSKWEIAVDKLTRGISPKSPHAVMMRTISDRSRYTLFDPIWDKKRPETWNPEDLFELDLDFLEIADNAFELGLKDSTYKIMQKMDSDQPEIQYHLGRFYFLDGDFLKSQNWLSKAAEAKHPKAIDYLGDLYHDHLGEVEKALDCWKEAASLGNVWAMDSLGDYYSDHDLPIEAEKWWAEAAKQDNQWARASLGNHYLQDGRVEEGLVLLKESAEKQNPWAMRQLGIYYESKGDPVLSKYWWTQGALHDDDVCLDRLGDLAEDAGDKKNAELYWRKAVALGNSWSMASLGLHMRDEGFVTEGEDLLLQSANLGNSWAMRQIALLKEDAGDASASEEWFVKAAHLHDEVSIFRLGMLAWDRDNDFESEEWFENGIALNQGLSFRGMGLLSQGKGLGKDSENYWTKAALLGDVTSMDYLGDYFEEQGDIELATEWWSRAANEGNPHSMYSLGWEQYKVNNEESARDWWTKAANLKLPRAMAQLGDQAQRLDEMEKAEYWWELAAELDDELAIFRLGRLAMAKEELTKSREWFDKGISLNHPLSYRGMGFLEWYLEDIESAKKSFERAADLEDSISMDALGDIYEEEGSISDSHSWWSMAAENDNADSMYSLGWLEHDQENSKLAEEWWLRAAELGNDKSMDSLGDLANERNLIETAEKWWKKAALLGNQYSMISLHSIYKEQKKFDEALNWLEICGNEGNETALALLAEHYEQIGNDELHQYWSERLAASNLDE